MNAAPGDNLEFGEGSKAQEGERAFPGVLSAFHAAYSTAPHLSRDLGLGVFAYDLLKFKATVFFSRTKNKVVVLLIRDAGVLPSKAHFEYLSQLAAILQRRGGR